MAGPLSRTAAGLTSTNHKEVYQSTQLDAVLTGDAKTSLWAPYSIPPAAAETLAKAGVPLPSNSTGSHPHPACYTLGAYYIYSVLPNHITSDATILQMKHSKVQKLAGLVRPSLTLTSVNLALTAKDLTRFPESRISQVPPIETSLLILHEMLQFMTFRDVYELYNLHNQLQDVLAIAIIPPETPTRTAAFWPDVYKLSYQGDQVAYLPDGVNQDAYFQPTEAIRWLTTRSIHGPTYTLTISILHSTLSHHLIHITKRQCIPDTTFILPCPELVSLPRSLFPTAPLGDLLIPRSVQKTLHRYALAVSPKSDKDAFARARLLERDNNIAGLSDRQFVYASIYCRMLSIVEKPNGSALLVASNTAKTMVTRALQLLGLDARHYVPLDAVIRAFNEDISCPPFVPLVRRVEYHLSSASLPSSFFSGSLPGAAPDDLLALCRAIAAGGAHRMTLTPELYGALQDGTLAYGEDGLATSPLHNPTETTSSDPDPGLHLAFICLSALGTFVVYNYGDLPYSLGRRLVFNWLLPRVTLAGLRKLAWLVLSVGATPTLRALLKTTFAMTTDAIRRLSTTFTNWLWREVTRRAPAPIAEFLLRMELALTRPRRADTAPTADFISRLEEEEEGVDPSGAPAETLAERAPTPTPAAPGPGDTGFPTWVSHENACGYVALSNVTNLPIEEVWSRFVDLWGWDEARARRDNRQALNARDIGRFGHACAFSILVVPGEGWREATVELGSPRPDRAVITWQRGDGQGHWEAAAISQLTDFTPAAGHIIPEHRLQLPVAPSFLAARAPPTAWLPSHYLEAGDPPDDGHTFPFSRAVRPLPCDDFSQGPPAPLNFQQAYLDELRRLQPTFFLENGAPNPRPWLWTATNPSDTRPLPRRQANPAGLYPELDQLPQTTDDDDSAPAYASELATIPDEPGAGAWSDGELGSDFDFDIDPVVQNDAQIAGETAGGSRAEIDRLFKVYSAAPKVYQVDKRRAKIFLSDLKNGFIGIASRVLPEADMNRLDALIDNARPKTVLCVGTFGIGGSGKSHGLVSAVKAMYDGDRFPVGVIRAYAQTFELRTKLKNDLEVPRGYEYCVQTWEKPFLRSGPGAAICYLDDCSLFYPGWLDAYLLLHPKCRYVLFSGDPSQGIAHSEHPNTMCTSLPPTSDNLAPFADSYRLRTWRQPPETATPLGLISLAPSKPSASLHFAADISTSSPILTADSATCRLLRSYSLAAVTVSSSQGTDFERMFQLLVTPSSILMPNRLWYTALTRGKGSIRVVVKLTDAQKQQAMGSIPRALIELQSTGSADALRRAVMAHINSHIPQHLRGAIVPNTRPGLPVSGGQLIPRPRLPTSVQPHTRPDPNSAQSHLNRPSYEPTTERRQRRSRKAAVNLVQARPTRLSRDPRGTPLLAPSRNLERAANPVAYQNSVIRNRLTDACRDVFGTDVGTFYCANHDVLFPVENSGPHFALRQNTPCEHPVAASGDHIAAPGVYLVSPGSRTGTYPQVPSRYLPNVASLLEPLLRTAPNPQATQGAQVIEHVPGSTAGGSKKKTGRLVRNALLEHGPPREREYPALTYLPHLDGDIADYPVPISVEYKAPTPGYQENSYAIWLAAESTRDLVEQTTEQLKHPDHREVWCQNLHECTQQIMANLPANAPLSHHPTSSSITELGVFLHHRNGDAATQQLAEQKRIKRSTLAANERSWAGKMLGGEVLFHALMSAIPVPATGFDQELFEECRRENDTVALSKPLEKLLAQASRSDPDWSFFGAELFMKNQVIKKLEKLGSDAKPGQIIVSFRTQLLLFWGPFARYIWAKVAAATPANIYIHARRSPDDLAEWCKEHWRDDVVSTDGDYTAYDSTQDAAFGNMELMLMDRVGIPLAIQGAYKEMKSRLTSRFGYLAVMRFTGEVFTYLFNTLGNIAFTHAKYIIPAGTPQLYGGDDKSIACVTRTRPGWSKLAHHFALVEKPEERERGLSIFCGWTLTPRGIIKDPKLLFWRTRYMSLRYDPGVWAPNYYEELHQCLRCPDALDTYLDFSAQAHLYYLVRYYSSLSVRCPPLAAAVTRLGPVKTLFAALNPKHTIRIIDPSLHDA